MVTLDEVIASIEEIVDEIYYELEEEDKEEFVG